MSIELITTHRTFDRLEPAKQWLEANTEQCGEQLSFLVMSTSHLTADGKRSWRKFDVTEVRTWLDVMQRTQAGIANATTPSDEPPITFNELVIADAPCKTFAEFDFKKFDEFEAFGAASAAEMSTLLDAMFTRFTEFLVGKLNELMRTQGLQRAPLSPQTDVIVLTAHRVGKWSTHLIVDPPLAVESVVWRTMAECGNFITDTLEAFNEPLATETLDQSVYSANHALRIYRAAKPEEPQRILRDTQSRYSEATMIRSLISCLRVKRSRLPDDVTQLHNQEEYQQNVLLSSAFVARYALLGDDWRLLTFAGGKSSGNARATNCTIGKRTGIRSAHSVGSERARAVCAATQLAEYQPKSTFIQTSLRQTIIGCNTNRCELKGGEHKDKHFPVYLELDMLQCRWRQSCMSGNCDRSTARWRDMDVALRTACIEYLVNESSWCTVVPGVNRCLFGRKLSIGDGAIQEQEMIE